MSKELDTKSSLWKNCNNEFNNTSNKLCLGLTLDSAILNIGDREFACGITYTGCSRVKSLKSLSFDPMPSMSRLTSIFGSSSFKNMRKELERRHKINMNMI